MSAILRTGERFGVEHLVAMLTGDAPRTWPSSTTTSCRPSASAPSRKAGEWRSIFRQLSAVGLIAQDLMEHGRWWVTDEGWRVLKGEARIELRKDLSSAPPRQGSGAATGGRHGRHRGRRRYGRC